MATEKSYVYDGQEVRKTGRTAERHVPVPGKTAKRVLTIIEITPVGDDFDWKKWVSAEQLFEIVQ